jgi:hypothetical protein
MQVRFCPTDVPADHLPIYRLEAALLESPELQVDLRIEEDFCDGLYARTMHIPAGVAVTGAVHSKECFFLVRIGEIALTTDEGVQKLQAGAMLHSRAGIKRAAFAITDCVVTTFHPNPDDVRDSARLWEIFTIPAPSIGVAEKPEKVLA